MNNYPEPLKYENESRQVASIHPYWDLNWINVATKFHVKVPFDQIVDRTMGKSTCNKCKQIYSGHNDKCVRPVYWAYHKRASYNYDSRVRSNTLSKGDVVERSAYNSGEPSVVIDTVLEPCGESCSWDHQNKFYEQQSYFDFLNHLNNVVPTTNFSPLGSQTDLIDPAYLPVLHNKYLLNKTMELDIQVQRLNEAMKMVVQKINQAGICLTF